MMEEKAEIDLKTGQEGQADQMIDTDQVLDQEIGMEAEAILEIDQPQGDRYHRDDRNGYYRDDRNYRSRDG